MELWTDNFQIWQKYILDSTLNSGESPKPKVTELYRNPFSPPSLLFFYLIVLKIQSNCPKRSRNELKLLMV